MLMMSESRRMSKVSREGFIYEGFDIGTWYRGQQMFNIASMHHMYKKDFLKMSYRNKYSSNVWHDSGRTGCGCRTSDIRFHY